MKTLSKLIVVSVMLFAFSIPASAAISSDIFSDIKRAAGTRSNVRISISGDTVTLTGYVEDSYSLGRIERAARDNGAKKVRNYVLRSR